MNTITRRSLLVGAAAATVCGTAVASAAVPHPDAELIATYAEFRAVDIAFNTAPEGEAEAIQDERYGRWRDLFDRLTEFKAKTPEGLATLALAGLRDCDLFCNSLHAVTTWDGHSKLAGIDDADPVERILWNIVESARAMTAH
jgi:hypothetical protein